MFDLKGYRNSKGLTQSDLGGVFGVTQASIASVESGRNTIPIRWLELLSERYGDINLEGIDISALRQKKGVAPKNQDKVIPYYDIIATGSNRDVQVLDQSNRVAGVFINVGDLMPLAEFIIRVAGNSMTPIYPNGCLIGIRQVKDGLFDYGSVYVIETESNRFVKRIHKGKNDEFIQLYSDNNSLYSEGDRKGMPLYESFELQKSMIKRVFKVVATSKFNDHSHIP